MPALRERGKVGLIICPRVTPSKAFHIPSPICKLKTINDIFGSPYQIKLIMIILLTSLRLKVRSNFFLNVN